MRWPPLQPPTPKVTKPPTSVCFKKPGKGLAAVFSKTDAEAGESMTDHKTLVLGAVMQTSAATNITAIRWYKAAEQDSLDYKAFIYEASTGKALLSLDFSQNCKKEGWVSVPLPTPFCTTPKTRYIVAIDYLTYYVKVEEGLALPQGAGSVVITDGAWGQEVGVMPSNIVTGNYFIDGKPMDDGSNDHTVRTQKQAFG